jgi:flagellar biosynthesis protein FlhF
MATRIKRYEARLDQLDQLLARIESEMGPNAELETREFRRQRFLGLFGGQRMVEVIAVLEVDGSEEQARTTARPRPVFATELSIGAPREETPRAAAPSAATPTTDQAEQAEQAAPAKPVDFPSPPAQESGAGAPVTSQPRRVDLSADEPARFDLEPTSGVAETRITTDAEQFVRQAAADEELKRRQQAVYEARAAALKPEVPPEQHSRSTIPAMDQPAKDAPRARSEQGAPTDADQPVDKPEAASELADLRDTIAELKQTVKLLAASQQQRQDVDAMPSAPPETPPTSADEPEVPTAAPAGVDAAEAVTAEQPPQPAVAPAAETPQPATVADPVVLDHSTGLPDTHRRVYDRLLDWNIGPYDALELLNAALEQTADSPAATEELLLKAVFREICRSILLSEGIQLGPAPPGKAVALVGATGVGKTTTIAKLAAQYAFQQGRRVSLVSLDNYRIAAAEQLRTYADIMGLELDIVFSREEFDQVLTQRRSSDLILVDTAGRSPLNSKQVYELREIFAGHPPDEVHLVVAASTKGDDLRMLLESFEPLSYDHVIVSKLDETRSLGCLYNLIKHCQLPISYFTVGQSVPEDIRTANLEFVRAWIEQGRIS